MKKWMVITIIAILFVSTILFAFFINAPKVSGEDNVDMKIFNETITGLNNKIDNMQTEIDTLIAVNTDVQAALEVSNNNNASLVKEISNLKSLINSNSIRITNLETRESKLYKLLVGNYSTWGLYVQLKELKPEVFAKTA